MTEKRKSFLGNLLLGFSVAVMVIIFKWKEDMTICHRLCDGFFVAAAMLLGFGALKFARNGGTFDMMMWGFGSAVRMTFPWMLKERKDVDFVAFKERKKEIRQTSRAELLSGLVFLVLSLIFLVLYLMQL
jgi:hypothetical protein